MSANTLQASIGTIFGEQFGLDPALINSIRINTDYTNRDELPLDIEWKPTGNMAAKKMRYANKPKGRPLWQDAGGDRGDLLNVYLGDLVVGLVNVGMQPVKAYNEKRTGRNPGEKDKYRTTFVYMFPQQFEHRPEIVEILPKMAELRQRSVRQGRSLRRDNVWGHVYVYVNPHWEPKTPDSDELVDTGRFIVDITAIYKKPLLRPDGQPNRIDGQEVSALWSVGVRDRKLVLSQGRAPNSEEASQMADKVAWIADADAFAL